MTHRALQSRSNTLKKMLLFCGIVVGLIAGFASAQENATNDYDCSQAELGSYANMEFCYPIDTVVEPQGMAVENYSSGSEVWASLLLDGKLVHMHLLYPCQAPQVELEPADLKPYLEAYDPVFAQAIYDESITSPILAGQIADQKFIANQRNQSIFLVLWEANMSDSTMNLFVDSLKIVLNEGVTPPSNCPGAIAPETSSNETTSTASELEAEVAAALEPVQDNETEMASATEPETVETTETTIASGKEKMAADMAAAQAKMDELRKMARK